MMKNKLPLPKADIALYKELKKGAKVKVAIDNEATLYGGGYFDPSTNTIGVSEKNFANLAHELGHAEINEHALGRILQSQPAKMLYLLGTPLAALGAAVLLNKGNSWGALLPAAAATPLLASEALASIKGDRKLKEIGASKEQKSEYRKHMLQGFSSYTFSPALHTIHGMVVAALMAP